MANGHDVSFPLRAIKALHITTVSDLRKRELARLLSEELPVGASVLDIGCGDGAISALLKEHNASLTIQGLEVSPRASCSIQCSKFDGQLIPYPDKCFDCCMFVDVLHHTEDPVPILLEAVRVSRRFVLIKEHLCEGRLDWWTLKFMDWMGNRADGVCMTYNYKSRLEWEAIFERCGLGFVSWNEWIKLHRFPLSVFFSRRLHVVTLLEKRSTA